MPKFTQFVFFREYMNTILINKGFFSGEMHKIQFYSNRRNGHEDIPEEEFEDMMDMFDPNIALPDNLTFIDDTVLPQINPEGNRRDWGTGIAQKKFRVGSPTFFANGINIPGIILSFMHISKIYVCYQSTHKYLDFFKSKSFCFISSIISKSHIFWGEIFKTCGIIVIRQFALALKKRMKKGS